MTSWRELQTAAEQSLQGHAKSSKAEARWMVAELSGFDITQLVIHREEPAGADAVGTLNVWLERRAHGEPLQYILGHWSFRGLDLLVDERVLIPRPETEVVVQTGVDLLQAEGPEDPRVADLGTGSGAIAISLAREIPHAKIWATDVSESALELARANAKRVELDCEVEFLRGDWFAALPHELRGKLNLIVSNPPYIARDEIELLPNDVRTFEPREALVSGDDGLDATRLILSEARDWLVPAGHVVLEIAEQRSQETINLAQKYGFTQTRVQNDLAGKPRCLVAS